jgi:putative restriction endonuclease
MNPAALAKYVAVLANLHRFSTKAKGAAPHKPVLLLAILHEIDAGRINQNLVRITPELVASFHTYWQALVPAEASWNPKMNYPFRYLKQDGFWDLVKNGQIVTVQMKHEPTLNQLAVLCDGGRFADDIWSLLTDPPTRDILRNHIQATYFSGKRLEVVETVAEDYLLQQAEKLKKQAQAKFKAKRIVETTDGYFVRNRLFPKVLKELYNYSCCVCDLSASLGNSSLIDGAHILPFSDFHNDDPRNGLALCKNHHWGFDCGAWSLNDQCEILVSPKLMNDLVYIKAGQPLAPPKEKSCRPDPEALKWHRERWGFSLSG